jgi:hypothetical protein
MFDDVLLSSQLNLIGASPSLCPAPDDWKGRHEVCGVFTVPHLAEPWEPDAVTRDFFEAGAAPVFLSLEIGRAHV